MSTFDPGSGLEIPGLEAVLEYGDSSKIKNDRIPGAMLINDRTVPEMVRLTAIDGLQDDPDGRDTREPRSGRHGERAGQMLYGGKTIGLTGHVQAGNVRAMRDTWGRFRGEFGLIERDLLVHSPDEVPLLVNEAVGVGLATGANSWLVISSGSTTLTGGVADGNASVGQVAVTGLSGTANSYLFMSPFAPYDGRDAYVFFAFKIQSASATVSSVQIGVMPDSSTGGADVSKVAMIPAISSPTTGTWYAISGRISAVDLLALAPYKSLALILKMTTSGTSAATIRFDRPTMVLLDPSAPTPVGWVSGDSPGYEFEDGFGASRSYGPCYAVNEITDPLCLTGSQWSVESTGSPTVASGPTSTPAWSGEASPASIYLDATQATSGTRLCLTSQSMAAMARHTYRLDLRLKVLTNGSGTIDVLIRWLDRAGSTISTSAQTVAGTGEFDVSVTGVAPDAAVAAKAVVGYDVSVTTGSSQRLQLALTDPCFVDVTYHDPGSFSGAGRGDEEVALATSARRRIPRPWLVQHVRKASDAKAPEQQTNTKAWRDFTMSLRAADPRLYVLDERRASLKLTTDSKFVSEQAPAGFTLETAGVPVPTGWTYEGHFITNPGGVAAPYKWSREADFNYPFGVGQEPDGGVTLKSWNSSGAGVGAPTQSIVARMYRSAEGYTYTKPRVVLGCAPSMADTTSGSPDVFSYIVAGSTLYSSRATILLKRVSSTTWLELRWNSISHATAALTGATGTLPWAFELWCSHNTSGTLATTRLATWDYASYDSSNARYPFLPESDPQWLVSWLDASNVVHWELWRSYPSAIDTSGRYESGSFTLPSGLISVVGAGVAGSTGRSMTIDQSSSGALTFGALAVFPPFWHYFESSVADVAPATAICPVISRVDTPQTIVLRGGLVDPVLQFSVPDDEDGLGRTSVARFVGTFLSTNPVTIDVDKGTIVDSRGVDSYGMVLPGYADFAQLRQGINQVSLQAKSWSTSADAHAVISWRDALR